MARLPSSELRSLQNRFGFLYLLSLVFLLQALVVRTILFIKALPGMDHELLLLVKVYGTGFFYDCVTFSYVAIPFALYLVLVPDRIYRHRYHQWLAHAVFFAVLALLLFDIVAEYLFFDEFETRFNFIAIDYLVYTREVVGNIRESYPLNIIFTGILAGAAALHVLLRTRVDRAILPGPDTFGRRARQGLIMAMLPVLSFAFVDQSFTNISPNNYANELAGNGIYDLFAAFRNNELDFQKFYPTMDEDAALRHLRELLAEKTGPLASSDPRDITRVIANPVPEKKLNIVVIIEESLSAEYLGAFGNPEGHTPNLDRLVKESLLFTHAYATGTRTVRGLEAITLSIPPLPGTSIVKRPRNEDFFSWGTLMRSKGYDTRFVYGGQGYFDNMNYFFSHNGFAITDRSDLAKDEITFSNVWGVCDEDLFRRVIREGSRSHAEGRPFFFEVMTTSNHRPYTYPEGKIDVPSGTGRGGGVKYADYAIGRFIDEVKRQPWFKDTVIVIVADHCAASGGKVDLPVKRYEIPLLVYSPAYVRPGRVDRMMSQIDIAPTVLGILNMSYRSKFFGRDILKASVAPERAFISTYQKLGYITGDRLLVVGPKKRLDSYVVARADGSEREAKPREEDVADTMSYFQGASYIYKNRLNRFN
ncbi:MAG: LTA synthase family protein [Nitrospirae bacterium]|nr:LTA synthase family protein [Nitrospirota bacterium]NTW64734.1 LTA synthase family protein [Nitrospirota bacterium]